MGALLSGVNQAKEKSWQALELMGLDDKAEEEPSDLSAGQIQRIQLARQLVIDSKIMILDEPTASLDVVTAENFLDQLEGLVNQQAACMVSFHDLDLLDKYCNKVLWLEDGHLDFFGSLEDFKAQYTQANEYQLTLNRSLSMGDQTALAAKYRIQSWQPLTVVLAEEESPNRLISDLMASGYWIEGLQQEKKTLKEIMLSKEVIP